MTSFLIITGCAIDTGVIPLNNDTFTITKQAATGFTGIDVVKEGVVQEAKKYCANLNKPLKITTLQQTQPPYIGGNFPRVDMTFSCESNRNEHTTTSNVSHNKNINCNTDTDCPIGLNCRFQPNSFGNVCKPTESKYSDELTSETPQETQKPLSSSKPINLENFKAQCKEIGFKVGTADFGNCVLELNDAK